MSFNTIYVWKGASGGDWFDNHNWTPGFPEGASPPGDNDLAIFNDGGADSFSKNGTASELDVVLGTTLTILDSVSLDGAITGVGLMIDSGGKVIVGSGATKPGIPSPGNVSVDVIGFTGAGELDVTAGGGLDDTGMVLGDRSGASGTLIVDGAGSQVIVAPAAAPNGMLIIGNGGTGTVSVRNGGSLSAVSATDMGEKSGSAGSATLNGAAWFAGLLTVGLGGEGSVDVQAGGVLTTTSTNIGAAGTGTMTVESGGSLVALLATVLGRDAGSSGTATLDASEWSAGSLTIGQSGLGIVTVLDGGVLTAKDTAIGAGGTLVASGTSLLSPGTVTATGITMSGGTLDVSSGGIVVISASATSGPTGTMLVDDSSQFTGLGTINGNVVLHNQGTLLATGVAPGALVLNVTGDISGGGTLEPLMTLDLNGAVAPGVHIVFQDPTLLEPGVLILDDPTVEDGTISGFAEGNKIEIPGGSFTSALFNQGDLANPGTLILSGGTDAPLSLPVAGGYASTDFMAVSDAVGTTVTLVPCFVNGTMIATGEGEIPVERLEPGMRVLTKFAGLAPVTWIGFRRVDCRRHPDPTKVWPVCVRAGAFGPGAPARDLWLSPDHAVFAGGVLIPVKCLITRTSIAQIPRDEVMYYHVQVAAHDVLLAEGLAVESYLDTGDRGGFANGGPIIALQPDFSARAWEMAGCAELVQSGPILTAVRELLSERAGDDEHAPAADVISIPNHIKRRSL
jgi:collagen type I/II/III/V/XI/XXIV/XXVII alpha